MVIHLLPIPESRRQLTSVWLQSLELSWGQYVTRKSHWLLFAFWRSLRQTQQVARNILHGERERERERERESKAVSKYAASIMSTRCYERSLYEEVLADELWHLQNTPEIPLSMALLHPKPAPKKLFEQSSKPSSFQT